MMHVARTGARRGAYMILVNRHEGKEPFGMFRHRRECNNKVDLR
jgi:hypothetical protein